LTSALDGDEWSDSRHGRFTPKERSPGTHWIGGWVVPRAGLDALIKIHDIQINAERTETTQTQYDETTDKHFFPNTQTQKSLTQSIYILYKAISLITFT